MFLKKKMCAMLVILTMLALTLAFIPAAFSEDGMKSMVMIVLEDDAGTPADTGSSGDPTDSSETETPSTGGTVVDTTQTGTQGPQAGTAAEETAAPSSSSSNNGKKADLPTYLIRFLDCEGVIIKTAKVVEGEQLEDPKLYPTQEGYAFTHWYNAKLGYQAYDFDTPVTQGFTLRPFITEIPDQEPSESETADEGPANEQGDGNEENAGGGAAPGEGSDAQVTVDLATLLKEYSLLRLEEQAQSEETAEEPEAEEAGEDEAQEGETPEAGEKGEEEAGSENAGTEEAEADKATERGIFISINAGGEVRVGDTIVLTATVVGYEGAEIELVWQCNDGNGWVDAQAGGLTYAFTLDENNYEWDWRVGVRVIAEAEAAQPETEPAPEPEA